jgi:phosphate transport system permease protein
MTLYSQRVFVNRLGIALSMVAMAFGLAALLWILWTLFYNGFAALSVDFSPRTPRRRVAKAAACAMPSSAA